MGTPTVEEHDEALRENRSRSIDKVAEQPTLKLLARINMAYITPSLLLGILTMGGLIWNDQREAIKDGARAQKEQQEKIIALASDVNSMKGSINNIIIFLLPSLQTFVNSRLDAQAGRIDALVRSDEQQTRDIRDLFVNGRK